MKLVTQEAVETLLLTQPAGVLLLMQRMGEHLRADVRALFPTLTSAEHQAVCVRDARSSSAGVPRHGKDRR